MKIGTITDHGWMSALIPAETLRAVSACEYARILGPSDSILEHMPCDNFHADAHGDLYKDVLCRVTDENHGNQKLHQ